MTLAFAHCTAVQNASFKDTPDLGAALHRLRLLCQGVHKSLVGPATGLVWMRGRHCSPLGKACVWVKGLPRIRLLAIL